MSGLGQVGAIWLFIVAALAVTLVVVAPAIAALEYATDRAGPGVKAAMIAGLALVYLPGATILLAVVLMGWLGPALGIGP